MLFIDSPSQFAPVATWQAYALRLEKLNPHDRTVRQEKARAKRIIAILTDEEKPNHEGGSAGNEETR